MENINIKVILDEVFGKSCNTSNNIACHFYPFCLLGLL